jgi:hypothetical protein
MLSYKEFYIWLDGFVTQRHWTQYRKEEVDLILEKMKEVKDEPQESVKITPFERIPVPINPFPKIDPYSPPFEVYCGDKTQLND